MLEREAYKVVGLIETVIVSLTKGVKYRESILCIFVAVVS